MTEYSTGTPLVSDEVQKQIAGILLSGRPGYVKWGDVMTVLNGNGDQVAEWIEAKP